MLRKLALLRLLTSLRSLGCDFFAVVATASLAQKQPSPVVNKQHFEVVCFPPARFLRSLVRAVISLITQKGRLDDDLFVLLAGATRLELATSCVTGMHSNQLNYAPTEYSCFIYNYFLKCNIFFVFL